MNQQNSGGSFGDTVPEPKPLFYVLSFIIPIAGIILGALFLSKPDEEMKKFGKMCLILALIPIILLILMICCYILIYVVFIIGYFGFIAALIGTGAASEYAVLVPVLGAVALIVTTWKIS
ncbi:MAG: hypothetical protein GY771_14880 [bacterium]|nr:hypothetical protein [bacterium]